MFEKYWPKIKFLHQNINQAEVGAEGQSVDEEAVEFNENKIYGTTTMALRTTRTTGEVMPVY